VYIDSGSERALVYNTFDIKSTIVSSTEGLEIL